MDDLIEILFELMLEGSSELLKNKRVPKCIRYLIALVFISFIIAVIVLGGIILRKSIVGGMIIICTGVFLLIGITIKIKTYFKN